MPRKPLHKKTPNPRDDPQMPRITTATLITELLAARSGTIYLAREIAHILRNTYQRSASPKSISKTLILLEEDQPMVQRRKTTNKEKALYNTKFIYGHINFDEEPTS